MCALLAADKPLHSYVHCYPVEVLDAYLDETAPVWGTHKHCRNGLYRYVPWKALKVCMRCAVCVLSRVGCVLSVAEVA